MSHGAAPLLSVHSPRHSDARQGKEEKEKYIDAKLDPERDLARVSRPRAALLTSALVGQCCRSAMVTVARRGRCVSGPLTLQPRISERSCLPPPHHNGNNEQTSSPGIDTLGTLVLPRYSIPLRPRTPCPTPLSPLLFHLLSLLPFLPPRFPVRCFFSIFPCFFIFPPNVYPSIILLFSGLRSRSLSLRHRVAAGRASGSLHTVFLRVNKVSVNTRQPQRSFPSQRPCVIAFFPATRNETKQRLPETLFCFVCVMKWEGIKKQQWGSLHAFTHLFTCEFI